MRLVEKYLAAEPTKRRLIYASLTDEEKISLTALIDAEGLNPWAKYERNPVEFIEKGLGETMWSAQKQIAESVVQNQRTVVSACHAPGKSHLAARLVSWWIASHSEGTALAITIAPTHRQVRNIIWPHIRKTAIQADLPGEILTQTWKIKNNVVAYGFSPSPYDESATQGIHSPNLLIVVDEAGGIGEVVGQALEALMTGEETRILLLGNPPTDQEDSWFERSWESPLYHQIKISAYDTPNFTKEPVGQCKTCPPQVPPHLITQHLVDERWVDEVIMEFGDDSPFVEARVHARFPRSSTNKVIPISWLEKALEPENWRKSGSVKLGIDIAADGGDEFVIARNDGFEVDIIHNSSGSVNENAVDVASVCLRHIHDAEALNRARENTEKVKIKIDTIGVGWGVVSLLKKWEQERKHTSEIIAVNVAEKARDSGKFKNVRAEMWWNGRALVQPHADGSQDLKLNVDRKVLSQLSGPTFKSDSAGRIQIETKADMKKRGVRSPDRAEAILLAVYEPPGSHTIAAPIGIGQENQFSDNYFAGSVL